MALQHRIWDTFLVDGQGVDDSLFYIGDSADNTKKIAFDASGITTGTTRTITVPDYSFTLNGAGSRVSSLLGSADLSLATTQSGAVIECGAAEDFTLPAIASTEAGVWYEFVVTTTATSLTITAGAGDLLVGGVSIMSTSAGAENDAFSADGSDDLVITMNGTTSGGIVGSWVKLTASTTGTWLVRGGLIGSGTLVTPFS